MIKLFLITLLCVAVLADSPIDEFNQMWQTGKKMADMAEQVMMSQSSPLVRRAAQQQGQPPQGQPPQGQSQPPQGSPTQGQGQGGQQ